jgi:hypothetical protein
MRLGIDFAFTQRFELALNARCQLFDLRRVNRALTAGDGQRPFQLFALERLAFAFGFDDRQLTQLDAFKGCEASTAALALATAAYRAVILGRTAVLYLTVIMSTKRAAQLFFLIFLFVDVPVSDDTRTY